MPVKPGDFHSNLELILRDTGMSSTGFLVRGAGEGGPRRADGPGVPEVHGGGTVQVSYNNVAGVPGVQGRGLGARPKYGELSDAREGAESGGAGQADVARRRTSSRCCSS